MNFKKIVIVFITVCTIISSLSLSYAADTITLNEYIEEASVSNVDIKLLNEKISREQDEYDKVIQMSKAIDQETLDDSSDDYNLKVLQELKPLTEKKIFLDLKYELLKSENSIEKNATKNFYDYQVALGTFENSKAVYNTSLKKYENKKKEKDLGLVSETDYLKFEQEYYNAYIAYLNATNDFESLKKNINIFVSKAPSETINFEKIELSKIDTSYSINVEKTLEAALKNSYQIKDLELQNEINNMNLKLKGRFAGYTNIIEEMNNYKDSIVENDLKIRDVKFDLEYNLNKLSNELTIEKNKYAISEMLYSLSQKEFEASNIKYTNGMISELDYIKAEQDLTSAKLAYNNSRIAMAIKIFEVKSYVEENTILIK